MALVDRPSPRAGTRRWAPAAGIAAALLLVLGFTVALTQGGDDDSTPAVEVVQPPRRYRATDLPEGFELDHVGAGTEHVLSGPVVLYGPDPASPGLAVSVADPAASEPEWEEDPRAEPVEVGNRSGYRVGGDGWLPGAVAVTVGGRRVTVVGRDAELVATVAAVVTIAGDRPRMPEDILPADWVVQGEVADITALSPVLSSLAPSGTASTWQTSWLPPVPWPEDDLPEASADVLRELSITSGPGGATTVAALGLAAETEQVEVRGRDALLIRQVMRLSPVEGSEALVIDVVAVTWLERPGEVVQVVGMGLSQEAVLAAAASLEVVDDAWWARSVAAVGGSPETTVAEGRFSDGSPWVLTAYDSPRPDDIDLLEDQDAVASLQGLAAFVLRSDDLAQIRAHPDGYVEEPDAPLPPGFATYVSEQAVDDLRWLSGLVTDEVRTVEVLTADGPVVADVTARVEAFHGWVPADALHGWVLAETFHGWVLEIDLGADLEAVVLSGENGAEVGRLALSG